MKKILLLSLSILLCFSGISQQPKDKASFQESKPGYYQNSIMKDSQAIDEAQQPPKTEKRFRMDFTGLDVPNKVSMYKQEWHTPPLSQGKTGTCWCFSTTSFFESEVYRMTGQKIKLSEMYTVYGEYILKAKRYIRERGNSTFAEGSEANAVMRDYKEFGIVPEEVYTGMETGRKFHNHAKMFEEMNSYLHSLKSTNSWNETIAVETIKSIMNNYMGEPPASFNWQGNTVTPKEFLKNVLKLNMDDYVDILSIMQQPFWQQVEYEVGDNWWHCKDYYNVPLEDFMNVISQAIRNHYTMAIGGDVSEAGFDRSTQVALIPSFDIPWTSIDDNARQFRFSNATTTDDHGIHLVGYMEKDGHLWYLIKDSGSGSRNNDEKADEFGFYFFRDDYVKLKMMNFTVHKDAVKDLLKKFVK